VRLRRSSTNQGEGDTVQLRRLLRIVTTSVATDQVGGNGSGEPSLAIQAAYANGPASLGGSTYKFCDRKIAHPKGSPLECPSGAPPLVYDSQKDGNPRITRELRKQRFAQGSNHTILYTITFPHRLDGLEVGLWPPEWRRQPQSTPWSGNSTSGRLDAGAWNGKWLSGKMPNTMPGRS